MSASAIFESHGLPSLSAVKVPSGSPVNGGTTQLLNLHTYFLFPFAIDKAAVMSANQQFWSGGSDWLAGLDGWIASATSERRPALGGWWRSAYDRFDLSSAAYQDMVFLHPLVRRVFFDSRNIDSATGARQALLRCYAMQLDRAQPLMWAIEDARGRAATADITDLRLFLFANGVAILSIGVERSDLSASEALYLNEMIRKLFPSSDRQRREGRIPMRSSLVRRRGGREETIVCETFDTGNIVEFHPPLSSTIQSLLYFLDYEAKQYEQVLDERMIVYTCAAIDPESVGTDFLGSQDADMLMSRLLFMDRTGDVYRYDPEFTARQMEQCVYRRWAHEGTLYGFTRYSNVPFTIGVCDRGDHLASEGALIHRMFTTRYYLMALSVFT
jgi:hypothetical protein